MEHPQKTSQASSFKCGLEAQKTDQSRYRFSCKEATETVSHGDMMKEGNKKCISQAYETGSRAMEGAEHPKEGLKQEEIYYLGPFQARA